MGCEKHGRFYEAGPNGECMLCEMEKGIPDLDVLYIQAATATKEGRILDAWAIRRLITCARLLEWQRCEADRWESLKEFMKPAMRTCPVCNGTKKYSADPDKDWGDSPNDCFACGKDGKREREPTIKEISEEMTRLWRNQ